jgi:hypothetical protein
MKNLLTLIVFTLLCITISAQDIIRQKSCSSESIGLQVDSIKKSFEKNGFVILNEGAWYQIVFIGDPSSKIYEVRMYDYDEKQVYFKKLYGYSEGNIISYGYMPRTSEWHMIKPVQVNKGKKNCCGYIMLLKKVKGSADVVPAR